MFTGSCVALVTPMSEAGDVDFEALNHLVQWHLKEGTAAIVVMGTTGESATLNESEWSQVVEHVVEGVSGKIPVIAGTGTNATQSTLEKTLKAKALGVDGALVVTPFYNKPTQHGLIAHFSKLHEAIELPIILYNVPSRTGCDILPETVAELSQLKNIVGIKDATGDLNRLSLFSELCEPPFKLYSGDDDTAADFMTAGGHGVISVAANMVPAQMQRLCELIFKGEIEKAKALQAQLKNIFKVLGVESNPIPIKWVLKEMGRIEGGIRLPLTPLSKAHENTVRQALKEVGAMHV